MTASKSDLDVFRDLLARWARYVHKANLAALGYAQQRYTELVGTSHSGIWADPADDIDPDLLSWDSFFRGHLPAVLKEPIAVHYLQPGPTKTKHKKNGDQAYYARKLAAEETALALWRGHKADRSDIAGQWR